MPRPVRFGIAIVASEPPEDFIQTVRLAEESGFDSIWVPDYRLYRDVYVSLTLAALNTSRVRLGCAVTNPYTRHPALTAVGIASVDALSNGRAVLGACVEAALAAVGNGAWGVKRARETLEMVCWLQGCAVSDDRTEALKAVKPAAALTLGHAPDWTLEAMEIDESDVREIRKVYYTDGARAAAELVTDEMAEKYTIARTPEHAVRKIKRLRAQGFDEIIFLPDESGGNARKAMRTLRDRVIAPLRTGEST